MQTQLLQPRLSSAAQTGRLQRTRRPWSVRTQASSSSLVLSPGRWLWHRLGTPAAEQPASKWSPPVGVELTARDWAPYLASLDLSIAMMRANANKKAAKRQQQAPGKAGPYGKEAAAEAPTEEQEQEEKQRDLDVVQRGEPTAPLAAVSKAVPGRREERRAPKEEKKGPLREFIEGDLPKKLALLVALMVFSRVGVFIRLPGVDVDRFAETMAGGGLLGYIDALSGGSISKVGVFSLGIVPYINASIMLQLLATAFPSLKKLQREEGPQGRARFMLYQKLAALGFAVAQAYGQLTYISPFVEDFSPAWLIANVLSLTAGAMVLVHVADTISDLKLGNGTSILIFANIASSLPSSVGAAFTQAERSNSGNLALYALTVFVTTLGIVYVQLADREIPMTYASRYQAGALQRQAYLPFKVNATGVMPVIFASSLLALPSAAARYAHLPALDSAAAALGPNGPLYLPVNVALIVGFNYLYTFLQLEPKELAEQLKRQGASIPAVRPGRATAEFITKTLNRMSVLGSGFLGALAAAPALVEWLTGLQAFRGFAGTSVLILVGVATDTARKFRAELAMQKYRDIDKMYDQL